MGRSPIYNNKYMYNYLKKNILVNPKERYSIYAFSEVRRYIIFI